MSHTDQEMPSGQGIQRDLEQLRMERQLFKERMMKKGQASGQRQDDGNREDQMTEAEMRYIERMRHDMLKMDEMAVGELDSEEARILETMKQQY